MHSWFSQASIYQLTEGIGKKKYDEQFRLRMSMNPAGSWELWLMFTPATQLSLPRDTEIKIMHIKCFTYNYKGICQLVS